MDYYIAQKNYDKAFEYGDKLFALDPDNFTNAVNMIRAASETGDADRLILIRRKGPGNLDAIQGSARACGYGRGAVGAAKGANAGSQQGRCHLHAAGGLQRRLSGEGYREARGPADQVRADFSGLLVREPGARSGSDLLSTGAEHPENAGGSQRSSGKRSEQSRDVLLLSDYYSEKGEQLDKAETYAKKAIAVLETAPKPEGLSDEQWAQQKDLQKGIALSSLGQVNIQKKDNAKAVENLKAAMPLLKSDDGSYARNQYRLGFALLNLKRNAEAKEAFTQAASVNSPYKGPAQEKLKTMAGAGKAESVLDRNPKLMRPLSASFKGGATDVLVVI